MAQGNNLKALYLAVTSNAEKLEQKQAEQDKKQEDLLQEYGLVKPDISQNNGTESSEQGTTQPPEESLPTDSQTPVQMPSQSPAQSPSQTPAQTPSQSPGQDAEQDADQLQAELQGYINQLYQVQARYQQLLDEMVESTKKEFWSLPKDQQVASNKMKIVRAKMDDLIAQEKACDAEVEAILSDIQDVLKRQGKSTELVNEIRTYYEETKANWKAAKMTELYS
ncbi:Uncharacterised protein [uncultured Flavonifractor sp.]|nr:Uncharacterised protein [uncultured Flavonifractor sp.]